MAMLTAWDWVVRYQHVLYGCLYVLLNVMPRPHPAELPPGPHRTFWLVIDRLCVLSAAAMPGSWKMLFAMSSIAPQAAQAAPPEASGGAAERASQAPETPHEGDDKPAAGPYDAGKATLKLVPPPKRED